MADQEAERFQEALLRAAQNKTIQEPMASLVQTARQISILAELPPAPPHRLLPGRQRFLTEAARLGAKQSANRKRTGFTGATRLATGLMAVILVFGLVLGVGQVAADSLPGEPMYDLKLAAEKVRLALTTTAEARAQLSLVLAERRLDEVVTLLERGDSMDDAAVGRVAQQLAMALAAATELEDLGAGQALRWLEMAVQQRQRAMTAAMETMPLPQQGPVRHIVRIMEQVRQEALAGQRDPEGLRRRIRHGTPADPSVLPVPSHTSEATLTPGPKPTRTPHAALTVGPEPTHTPHATLAVGPESTHTPKAANTSQPTQGPHATHTPIPAPSHTPHSTHTPGPTDVPEAGPTQPPRATDPPGPRPTDQPHPTRTSGSGNGGGGKGKP